MTKEQIEEVKNKPRINPHKLFPNNPCPYSHIWEITSIFGEKYTIDWDHQVLINSPSQFPNSVVCEKITWARWQGNPIYPGLYLKLNYSDTRLDMLDHCDQIVIDGKEYVPYVLITPTPGRELPPEDNPNAEWTGFVTDENERMTNEEFQELASQWHENGRKQYFEDKRRQIDAMKMFSDKQKDYVRFRKPGYEEIVQMLSDYINKKIDVIDPDYLPNPDDYNTQEYDTDDIDFEP